MTTENMELLGDYLGFRLYRERWDRYHAFEIDGKLRYTKPSEWAIRAKVRGTVRRRSTPKREKVRHPVHWISFQPELGTYAVRNGFFRKILATSGNVHLELAEGGHVKPHSVRLWPVVPGSELVLQRYAELRIQTDVTTTIEELDEIRKEIRELQRFSLKLYRLPRATKQRAIAAEREIVEDLKTLARKLTVHMEEDDG